MQIAIRISKNRADMHYPLTDIQADFEINWLVRYVITAKKEIISTDDGRTDVKHDKNRYFFSKKK